MFALGSTLQSTYGLENQYVGQSCSLHMAEEINFWAKAAVRVH